MILRRMIPDFAARFANPTLTAMVIVLTSTGCSNGGQTRLPWAPGGEIEVVGTLVAANDGRPVDGGVDLTLETSQGIRELVRVPSAFTAEPREYVIAMHRVVDAAKVGDRLRALGTRDEADALRAVVLELVLRAPTTR